MREREGILWDSDGRQTTDHSAAGVVDISESPITEDQQRLLLLQTCALLLTNIFAMTPSSFDSMVTTALSVSISHRASPAATASPGKNLGPI